MPSWLGLLSCSIYEKIGKGKHSVVYKGRKKKTIQYHAIKSVDKSQKARVLQEVSVGVVAWCRALLQRVYIVEQLRLQPVMHLSIELMGSGWLRQQVPGGCAACAACHSPCAYRPAQPHVLTLQRSSEQPLGLHEHTKCGSNLSYWLYGCLPVECYAGSTLRLVPMSRPRNCYPVSYWCATFVGVGDQVGE